MRRLLLDGLEIPVPDYSAIACLRAGQILAPPTTYPTAPFASLEDFGSRKALVQSTETLIFADVGAELQAADVAVLLGLGKVEAGLELAVNRIVTRVRADHTLTEAAKAHLEGGLSGAEAAGIAMRYYAGFLAMAKALRDLAADGLGKPDVPISREGRNDELQFINDSAKADAVFRAGLRFGPWGRTRRGEMIFDQWLSAEFKETHLAEYYEQTGGGPDPLD